MSARYDESMKSNLSAKTSQRGKHMDENTSVYAVASRHVAEFCVLAGGGGGGWIWGRGVPLFLGAWREKRFYQPMFILMRRVD